MPRGSEGDSGGQYQTKNVRTVSGPESRSGDVKIPKTEQQAMVRQHL